MPENSSYQSLPSASQYRLQHTLKERYAYLVISQVRYLYPPVYNVMASAATVCNQQVVYLLAYSVTEAHAGNMATHRRFWISIAYHWQADSAGLASGGLG
jgi:hypothetical protein